MVEYRKNPEKNIQWILANLVIRLISVYLVAF